jgi:hypothetical protein
LNLELKKKNYKISFHIAVNKVRFEVVKSLLKEREKEKKIHVKNPFIISG